MAAKKGRLFADVMFPMQIVHALRRLGYEVQTAQQYQGTSRPVELVSDEEILDAAVRYRAAVLTLDHTDFVRLHYQRIESHRGIIICDHSMEFKKRAKEIDEQISANKPLIGKLIHVPALIKKD
jgi:UDP-N-acetyl-D-mannosaminuronate dehydrogenase